MITVKYGRGVSQDFPFGVKAEYSDGTRASNIVGEYCGRDARDYAIELAKCYEADGHSVEVFNADTEIVIYSHTKEATH